LKHASGLVEGKGFVDLVQRREFRFEGRGRHFDPSALVKAPAGDLNFDFVATGALEPAISGDVRLEIAQSRIGDLPASGTVRLAGDTKRIASADIRVALAQTSIQAKGAFGRAGDALDFAIHSPDLGALAKALDLAVSGELDARGTLTGSFAAPGGHVEAKGTKLAMPGGLYAASLAARADIATEPDGRVDAVVETQGLTRRSGTSMQALGERSTLTVQGTRSSHRATIVSTLSKDSELRANFEGGLEPRAPKPTWRGQVTALSLTGPSAFTLASPASLVAAADRIEIGDATLKGTWGEARLALTRWTPALIEARGSSPSLLVRNAARALHLTTIPRGNLAVAAEWDIRAAQTVDGVVSIQRTGGDLRIGDPPQRIELDELKLRIEANRGQAKATVSLHGPRIGRLSGEVDGTLQHVSAGFGLVPNAPIQGRVDAQMDSIAWMAAWMGPEARAEGSVNAQLAISGTAADPRVAGRIVGENVSLREPQSGFEVEKGVVALRLSERSIVVEKLVAETPWHPSDQAARAMAGFAPPASGHLTAEGSIDLAARTGAITIRAEAVPVTQLNTRFLALSGEARLEARSDLLLATGALKADAGWIGALATPLPSVSEDVVVTRTSTATDERRLRERVRMDVRFSLGDHVWYRGRGLNTRLAGDLRVTGELGGALRATGAIRTIDGTYDAYGQQLSIDHGTLTFFGSVENPSLDVLALRTGLPVEAGVEVLGNVSRPRVRLVSRPEVPDPEKISWLVLGRGPGDVSQGEASTLVAAANAILGRGSDASGIARRFGFDEVRIGRSDTASALGTLPQSTVAGRTGSASAAEVVTVGKRLSKNLYVVYEQGLADAEGALRLTWQITQKFQVLVRAGYLPGADAVYRWTFE
jgi:translocation and assembly module TamB